MSRRSPPESGQVFGLPRRPVYSCWRDVSTGPIFAEEVLPKTNNLMPCLEVATPQAKDRRSAQNVKEFPLPPPASDRIFLSRGENKTLHFRVWKSNLDAWPILRV